MRFAFTEEHDLFRHAVRVLLADLCTPSAVRASWDSDDGRIPGLWSALAEMGVLGALAPPHSGGLGLDEVATVRLFEEAGYACVPDPFMEHVAVAVPALAAAESGLLEGALTGELTATIALGIGGRHVLGADSADLVVREENGGLFATTEWRAEVVDSVDLSRRLSIITAVTGQELLASADLALATDRAVLATAAQCLGVARRLLDSTVEYVSERRQFARPVGSYQAVKHHLANVRLGIEFAAPLSYRAAWSVAHPETHDAAVRARDVSMAKAQASQAVDQACRAALQCHGAIGYTFEYDLQLWLKRGWALSAAYGDIRQHRDRVATALSI